MDQVNSYRLEWSFQIFDGLEFKYSTSFVPFVAIDSRLGKIGAFRQVTGSFT